MKFKVGDRVKLITKRHGVGYSNPYWPKYGIEGVITETWQDITFYVKWDNTGKNSYSSNDLELVDVKPLIDVDELFEGIEI